MLPIVFAVILGFGAWAAMRRNPAYSGRSLLRSLAVILLAIGVMIAVAFAAVNLTIHKSPVVIGVTLGAVIIFGVLAMIFIVRDFSTPQAAKLITTLPPAAKLVHIHRQKVYKWARFFAALILFFAILSITIPGNARYAVYAFGSITLLLAAILLPVMYVTAREFDVSLTALRYNPWVHWQYTPNQWQQWTNIQVDRMKTTSPRFVLKRDWWRVILLFAVVGGAVAFFSPDTPLEKTLYVLGLFALILWAILASRSAAEKMRVKFLKAPPEAYMGHDGVFSDGVFTTWLGTSVYLLSASIDERTPRSLLFCFEEAIPNPYGPNQIIPIHQSVLIPDHSERDIARVQQELTARCPNAQIQLA